MSIVITKSPGKTVQQYSLVIITRLGRPEILLQWVSPADHISINWLLIRTDNNFHSWDLCLEFPECTHGMKQNFLLCDWSTRRCFSWRRHAGSVWYAFIFVHDTDCADCGSSIVGYPQSHLHTLLRLLCCSRITRLYSKPGMWRVVWGLRCKSEWNALIESKFP